MERKPSPYTPSEDFFAPLLDAETPLTLEHANKLLLGLFDRAPIDVKAVMDARKQRQLAEIPSVAGREFPEGAAWNRMVRGGPMTKEAVGILDCTVREAACRQILHVLLKCRDSKDIINKKRFPAYLPALRSHIGEFLARPVINVGNLPTSGSGIPGFRDYASSANSKRQDRLAIMLRGWGSCDLLVNRQGLGWQTAHRVDGLRRRQPVARQRIAAFMGAKRPRIVEDDSFSLLETAYIQRAIEKIEGMREDLARDQDFQAGRPVEGHAFREVGLDGCDGFRFFARSGNFERPQLLIIDAATGAIAGGCSDGTPYVDPAYRRRGLGKAMHRADWAEDLGLFAPSHFSRSGFEARRAFHRDEVIAAHKAGKPVHPENLQLYARHLQPGPELSMEPS